MYWNKKGYATSYDVEILNSFNPELQIKDAESKLKKIHKIGKKNSIDISVFGNENKGKYQSVYQKHVLKKKLVDLLIIR